MDFKNRLKQLRLERGLTQKDLATIIGVGRTTVSEYEAGHIVPNQERLIHLAKYFGVSIDYLTGVSNSQTVKPVNKVQEIKIEKMIENLLATAERRNTKITLHGKPLNDYTAKILKLEVEHLLSVLKFISV